MSAIYRAGRDSGRPGAAPRLGAMVSASLLAVAAIVADAGGALPAESPSAGAVHPQAPADATRRFDIPAQDLAAAIALFADQSGLQLVYDTPALAGHRSASVRGDYPPEEALRLLLSQSPLTYVFTAPTTVTLRPGAAEQPFQLGGIVIAGEKVERRYLETFTSTGLVTEEQIETYGLRDLDDSFDTMANVRHFPGGRGNNGFQIRGVNADGVTQPANSAPLITLIVDGVTQSAESLKRGARGLWDVDQVEVLRGPQSMIQGRNALAGAVVVETNDPTYYPEVRAKGVVGTDDRREVGIVASAPIVEDQVAFRLSGEFFKEEKDIDIQDSAIQRLNEDKYWNARGKLLVEPDGLDDFRLLLSVSRVYDQPGASAVSGPDFFDRELAVASTFSEFREMNLTNYVADASYDFGNIVVRSVTALHDTDLSVESVPGSTFVREDAREDLDFTQDLRLEIPKETRGLSGVVGLFYGDFSQDITSFISVGGAVFQDGIFVRETETLAAYADLRYRVLPWASLIGGLRFQHDTVHNETDIDSAFGPTLFDEEAEFDVLLPKFGAAFDLTDTQTLAFTATRGYRQGFTEARVGTANDIVEVDPEFVWTYEIAYRQQPADGSFILGANLFYNDYSDQQITIEDPAFAPLANTRNAAESFSYGAEIEGRYFFDNGIQLFGAIGLLKSEFEKFADTGCAPSGGDCAGNEFPEAPTITAALGAAYYDRSGFFASANVHYTDNYFTSGDINNTTVGEIDGRFVADARIGYEVDFFTASLYANNIFDEDYLTATSLTGSEATIGDGREVGVELSMRF